MQNSPTNIFSIIRKVRNRYFAHEMVKGLVYFLIAFIASFAVLVLIDLAFNFNSLILNFLKYFYSAFIIIFFIYYLLRPLFFWLLYQGKYDSLWFARQIGDKVTDIDDKLINIIQLHKFVEVSDLALASIYQKVDKIDVTKLKSLYSLKDLYRGFLLLAVFFVVSGFLSFLIPDAIKYSGARILPFYKSNKQLFYHVEIENNALEVKKGRNFSLTVSVHGKFRPNEMYIRFGTSDYLMRDSSGLFVYKFNNVRQDLNFILHNEEFSSDYYTLVCIPVPSINSIDLIVDPPKYTFLPKEKLSNRGNATIAYGSKVSWEMTLNDTDSLFFINATSKIPLLKKDNFYYFEQRIFNTFKYSIVPINTQNHDVDTFNFQIQVQPDLYPEVQLVEQNVDAIGNFIFAGVIGDDYGIYKFQAVFHNAESTFTIQLPFDKNSSKQSFYYEGQLNDFSDSIKGNYVEIFLEVFDNDPFYPYKSTKSSTLYGTILNSKELSEYEQKKLNEVTDKLSFGRDILEQLKREKDNIKTKLLSEKLSKWEKNQLIDNMKNVVSEMQQVSDQINQIRDELKQIPEHSISQDLLEKRDLLNELLSQLMDDELAKMLEELKQLQEKLANDYKMKDLDQMDFSLDDMEKQLDRNLEMLKRYDIEKSMDGIVDDLKELAKQFENTDSLSQKNTLDSLHNQLQNQFKKHKDVLDKNKELESPFDISSFDKEKQEVGQKSKDYKNSKPSKSQNPSEDIKSLAAQMEDNMEQAMNQDAAESAELIRALLENILLFSFEQESLIKRFQVLSRPDNDMKREQIQLNERFLILEDSLQALMMRNVQLSTFVGGLLKDINFHFGTISERFGNDVYKSINVHQQSIMKSVNDLVLMLQESLKDIDSNMSGKGGNCKKPGKKKKPGMGDMKKQQDSFKKSVQDMIDGLKNGEKGSKGKQGMSQQLSKMLSEQEKMQQMLQELMQSGQVGQKTNEVLKEIGRLLDKNIDDIIQRNISDHMLNRQQTILNRMLEADKAEQERDKDDTREAEKPNTYEISNPKNDLEYKEKNINQRGIIVKPNIPLKYFFQRKYDKYLNNMENN